MASNTDSPTNRIYDLRDRISLNEAVLASLEFDLDSDSESAKLDVQETLSNLRQQLRELEAYPIEDQEFLYQQDHVQNNDTALRTAVYPSSTTWYMSNDGVMGSNTLKDIRQLSDANSSSGKTLSDADSDFKTRAPTSTWSSIGNTPNNLMPPTHKLASRKRRRGSSEGHVDARESKSLRATPSPIASRHPSPSPSTESFDSSDSEEWTKGSLLAGYTKEEERENMRAFRELERRKRQEQEDAELASLLAAELNSASVVPAASRSASFSTPSTTQIHFRGDGSLNRPNFNKLPERTIQRDVKLEPSQFFTPTPKIHVSIDTPNESDDSLEEIPAHLFQPRQTSRNDRRDAPGNWPSSQNSYGGARSMPGAFPGSSTYTGIGGTPVYTTSSFYSDLASYQRQLLGDPIGSFMSATAFGSFGTGYQGEADLPDYTYSNPAETRQEIKALLENVRPDEDSTPKNSIETPAGLKVDLLPHQIAGLAWMKKMEEGSNKGGILADDMGLGKTLQSIALILERPPPDDDRQPTLVVAPVALLEQWKRETQKMVRQSHALSVLILHGSNVKMTWNAIKGYDLVLTSYGTLTSHFKRRLIWEDLLKQDPDAARAAKSDFAILEDRAKFHRVILDEAQWIKNRNTKASIGACRLRSEYRWCLSGTPMQNSVEEIFSLIKFCRIRPYNSFARFGMDISQPLKSKHEGLKKKAMTQLQVLLKAILLRRTKQSKVDGKPILQLPPKTIVEDRAVFSPDELSTYRNLEKQAQSKFEGMLQGDGRIGRNYSRALVWLLRLRQCCCHPDLAQGPESMQSAALQGDDLISNAKNLSAEVIERLKEVEAFECPVCMDANENPIVFPCGHTLCSECLSKICDQAMSNEDGRANCPQCRVKVDAMKVTDYASFLRVHCPDRDGVEPLNDDSESVSSDCHTDDAEDSDDGSDLRDFIVYDDQEESEDEIDAQNKSNTQTTAKTLLHKSKEKLSGSKRKKKASRKREKAKSLAELKREATRNKAAKRKYLRRLEKSWKPSAKIEKAMEILRKTHDRGENEKTIIFSSFTSFLDLVEVPLSKHQDFSIYARYDGSMTAKDRNAAVLEFTDNPYCKIILVSIKAGNAGLNLTAANHVILLDPFWNPFVEYQAADRCYRIGQRRDVTVHRVLIGAEGEGSSHADDFTVEDRILALQEMKRDLVEKALDESAAQSVARLGTRELGYLFGLNSLR